MVRVAAILLAGVVLCPSIRGGSFALPPQTSAREQTTIALRQKAADGDAKAQVQVGLAYVSGDGVTADDAEAVKWFRKAADQDDPGGERYLAEMYFTGRGVPADNAQAAKWLRLAAEQNDPQAEHNLAVLYLQGLGVPQNVFEALKWMRKAAEQGLADGEFGLGTIYTSGNGIPPNDAEAAKWYRKAVDQGSLDAMSNLALLLSTSRDPNLRNPQEAIALATRAASAGNKAGYWDTLATTYYEAGQREKATETERKALALDPANGSYKEALDKYSH